MDLGLKKRVDEGEMVSYQSGVYLVELYKVGKKYKLDINCILKKANYSFNVISKELELLKSVHNLKEI